MFGGYDHVGSIIFLKILSQFQDVSETTLTILCFSISFREESLLPTSCNVCELYLENYATAAWAA
jgi:hypothetical protein